MKIPQPSVAEMVALIQSMPSAPVPAVADRFDPTKVPCVCGRYVPVAECSVAWSGFTNYLVALCPEHLQSLRECSRVVCPRCKTIVLLLEPFKDKHGFEFKKGAVYHVEACPICRPGLLKSAIVEKIVFYKQRGILYCEADQLIL